MDRFYDITNRFLDRRDEESGHLFASHRRLGFD